MRITKKQLGRIIKEELQNVLNEGAFDDLIDIGRKVIEKALEVGLSLLNTLKKACAQKEMLKMAVNNPAMIKLILQNVPAQTAASELVKAAKEAGLPIPLGSERIIVAVIAEMKKDAIFFPQLEKALKDENVRAMLVTTIDAACPPPEEQT